MRLPSMFVFDGADEGVGVRVKVRLRWWHPGAWKIVWVAIGDLLPARLKVVVVARIAASNLAQPAERWLVARGVATGGMIRRAVDRAEKEADGE